MEEEGENDEVDEGEELMPGVVLKRFATPETSATTVCPSSGNGLSARWLATLLPAASYSRRGVPVGPRRGRGRARV